MCIGVCDTGCVHSRQSMLSSAWYRRYRVTRSVETRRVMFARVHEKTQGIIIILHHRVLILKYIVRFVTV